MRNFDRIDDVCRAFIEIFGSRVYREFQDFRVRAQGHDGKIGRGWAKLCWRHIRYAGCL